MKNKLNIKYYLILEITTTVIESIIILVYAFANKLPYDVTLNEFVKITVIGNKVLYGFFIIEQPFSFIVLFWNKIKSLF